MEQKLADFLNRKVNEYNTPAFIASDPISVPHRYTGLQDIEISGFFAAIFAWGGRPVIIKKTMELMRLMGDAPYEFILHHSESDLQSLLHFRHRTFNTTDLLYFIHFLRHHYMRHLSLEAAFTGSHGEDQEDVGQALMEFHQYFFSLPDAPARTRKHIATPARHSSCKRLNMFLRWMVRKDDCGVDFGIWKGIRPARLVCPLDLHVVRVAKRFGLLTRKVPDWKAALELTAHLRRMDPEDPVKYDFALFGLGVMEKY